MNRFILAFSLTLSLAAAPIDSSPARTPADSAAIRAAALDYIEGWYASDADRMTRALHPELVRRIRVENRQTGAPCIDGMGAGRLIEGTPGGYGDEVPEADRRTDVTILDVRPRGVGQGRRGAVGRLHASVPLGDRWVIVNVLWEMRGN